MKGGLILTVIVLYFLCLGNIYADGRKFAKSYTANTMPANEFEFELMYFNTFDKMAGTFITYMPRFELEYGLLDKLTASFYFNFKGVNAKNNSYDSEPFKLKSNSLELRYRLTEEGKEIIDPALYFEFEYGKNVVAYEPKIILSKDYKKFTSVLNITSEFERETSTNEKTTNFEITGGTVYQFTRVFGAGIEFRHSRVYEDTFGNGIGEATLLGPTINIKTEEINLAINIMRQVAGSPVTSNGLELLRHEKYEFAAILEIEM